MDNSTDAKQLMERRTVSFVGLTQDTNQTDTITERTTQQLRELD